MRRGIDRELDDNVTPAEWRLEGCMAPGLRHVEGPRRPRWKFYADRRRRDEQRMERVRKQMRGK